MIKSRQNDMLSDGPDDQKNRTEDYRTEQSSRWQDRTEDDRTEQIATADADSRRQKDLPPHKPMLKKGWTIYTRVFGIITKLN